MNAAGTGYTGTTISGNPVSYYNGTRWTFDWEKSRQLVSAESDDYDIEYTYDMAGIRDSKTVNGVTYHYDTLNGKVVRQTWTEGTTEHVFDIIYDASGLPYSCVYNGSRYYYVLNQQGDVIRIVGYLGATLCEYQYDAWGNMLISESNQTEIGRVNPIRYRGYYYDTETGFYYLQSRYYDPSIGRFINADDASLLGANGDFISYNLFAYCLNNPVNRTDTSGNLSFWASAGILVGTVICVAAVTVLTCGVGTATLAGAVAVGAAKGALIGASVGTAAGAGIGYAATGTLDGAATGAAIGFGAGAVIGAAIGGNIGANSWYNARALEFTNPGSNEVVLGRSGTYEQMAQSRGSTYFHTSNARWNEVQNMFGVGQKGMWKINKAFLDQQIAAGRSFVLSNNPITDGGVYFAREIAYIVSKGIGYSIL